MAYSQCMAKPQTAPKTQIIYQEHDLDDVINYFAIAFQTKMIDYDYFLDAAKNKVVFKLVVEK